MRSGRLLALFLFLLNFIPLQAEENPAQQLHSLFDRDWEYQMRHDPIGASELGDRRWNDQWPDVSLSSLREQFQNSRQELQDLHAIDRSKLNPEDQLNYDVFEYNTKDYVESEQYKWYLVRTNTFSGIQTVEGLVDSLRFETVKDYDDWLGRLHNFPAYMDQNISLMREGIKQHVVIAKVIGEKVLTQFNAMDWQDPTKHGFYKPFKEFPSSFSDIDKQRLTIAAKDRIAADVLPAFHRFLDFMEKEYIPASLEQAGIWQVPNSASTYAYLARSMTTTTLTPEQVHEIGLNEVKRIRAEMEKVKDQAGFKGTLAEFLNYLRTDPKFYFKDSDELLRHA